MTPREFWISKMKPPSKKLREFCNKYNLSWSQLDSILNNISTDEEFAVLDSGDSLQIKKVIQKYLQT